MPVRPDQSILEAAEEHGVAIVNECQSGICGTCVATCARRATTRWDAPKASPMWSVTARKILTCQTFADI